MNKYAIEEWKPLDSSSTVIEDDIAQLAEVLHACVHGDASVNFILPFSRDDAVAFWNKKIVPDVHTGNRRLLVARLGDKIVGTVNINFDTPQNQIHRAEVTKLLVHPDARRHGIARKLMAEIEKIALSEKRTLITLDTRDGDAAEKLYCEIGYICFGVVPDYAENPVRPKALEGARFFYKDLRTVTPA